MARPRGRRRSTRSSQSKVGIIIASLVLGGISLAMIAGYAWLNLRAEGNVVIDKASGCPIAGPNSVTAVLFDASDPMPTSTQADVANKFRNIAEGIPQGGYLWVGVLTPQPGELRVLFSHCNPGDGASVDSWTSNPARHQKIWEEAFAKPLKNLPSELPASETANTSPVMAGIQQLKLKVFDSGMYDRVNRPGIAGGSNS